ncbi:hypothetical protein G9P44_002325 [Scheffersomyces stipitis]|nr:hypothetical protein G9P44_002325 [Scheffersomyces stipitis]
MTEWAETLQRSPVKESDELLQTYRQKAKALQAKLKTEGHLSDEEYNRLDDCVILHNHLYNLSEASYREQQKRFDDWNTPEEVRISTLSAIGRNVAEKQTVRVHIESFETRMNHLSTQLSISEIGKILVTHFSETIPATLDEVKGSTEQEISSLRNTIELYKDNISPGDPSESEWKRSIEDNNLKIKELENRLQITKNIYDIKTYFNIHSRDNSHLDFVFTPAELRPDKPTSPPKSSVSKLEEIFDPYYAGVEGNYKFKLKLIPISRAPNVFLVCVTAPNSHTDMDSLVHVMFNPNKQYGYSQRQVGEPISYKVLAKHLVEKRYYGDKQHNSLTKSVFYLIETESDRIIRRRNGLLKGVQIDIISSYRSPYPHQSYK